MRKEMKMDKFEKAAKQHKGLYVEVAYNLNKYLQSEDYDNLIERVAKKHNGSNFGSGAGFIDQKRDISFGFVESKKANSFVNEVKKACKKVNLGIKVKTITLEKYYS
jgi:transposase